MSRKNPILMFRLPALIAAALLAACTKPAPTPELPPAASPAGESPAPPPPGDAPAGPAQPSPDAPSPEDSSPAPQPATREDEPALETMHLASTNAKIGVPVDLRYSFDGDVLHLAAVPRVAGSDLRISVQHDEGLQFSEGSLRVQKAARAGVYRKQMSITRLASGPAQIRVLVTMGVGEGSSHGFFMIPLDSVKQH